jgi:hypothetical protein
MMEILYFFAMPVAAIAAVGAFVVGMTRLINAVDNS